MSNGLSSGCTQVDADLPLTSWFSPSTIWRTSVLLIQPLKSAIRADADRSVVAARRGARPMRALAGGPDR